MCLSNRIFQALIGKNRGNQAEHDNFIIKVVKCTYKYNALYEFIGKQDKASMEIQSKLLKNSRNHAVHVVSIINNLLK